MDLAEGVGAFRLFVDLVVHESEAELHEDASYDEETDDLVGGGDVLRLVVFERDVNAQCKPDYRGDETDSLDYSVGEYSAYGTQ